MTHSITRGKARDTRNAFLTVCPLFFTTRSRGFTLLIAVIFMSVMLSFGLALSSIGYKQQVLASGSIASQYAFYVADTALECVLFADQQQDLFGYSAWNGKPKSMMCDGTTVAAVSSPPSSTELVSTVRLSLDSGARCADVTVYKYNAPQPPDNFTTYIFAIGYDVSCDRLLTPDSSRFVSRGVSIHY